MAVASFPVVSGKFFAASGGEGKGKKGSVKRWLWGFGDKIEDLFGINGGF